MNERYIYRSRTEQPTAYEQGLARAIYRILESGAHGLPDIVRELNKGPMRPPSGEAWSEQTFTAEMQRLGEWRNSVGGPLGAHS